MTAQNLAPRRGLEYKWKVLISVVFGIFMIILDSTVVNVALQTLRREFDAPLNQTQWIISIYVLALGITTPLSGFLADRFGLKNVYIGGLVLFVTSSLLCGLSPNLEMLIVFRALQGVGGGMAQPLGPALLYRTFPANEQGKALGFFGIALVLAPALGPLLGGWLVDAELWRWIFFINVPIGVLGVSLASRFLRKEETTRKPTLDPLGIITATVGFGSLLYGATNAADLGWTSTTVLLSFGVGIVALIAFAIIELFVVKEPLLDLRLFKTPAFLTASLIGYVSVLALFGAEFLMPVYLQALRGRTALETGTMLLALALTSGIAAPIAGQLYDKIGPRPLVVGGFSLLLVNTWQLSQIKGDTSIGFIIFLLALRGLALGMTVQTTFATALSSVPPRLLPRGSSLINGTRFVVQSIGVAVLATVLTSALSPAVRAQSAQAQESAASAGVATRFGVCETPGVTPADNIPPAAAAQISGLPQAQQAAAKQQILAGVQQACSENLVGFEQTYLLTFYAAMLALFIALFLPGWPAKWAGRAGLRRQHGEGKPAAAD
ncbi:DHA2 family efflux MFS transporter permease subunit [Oscillochloris sp. ZM17-4]|uniref:DHA2 family efflux MFS transporter permease subunit n=1 Tax=Oscillochloris sp. ZM17-4 TaxID=2866714 RepID=UPI001C72AE19|nr:DHA2 family efflux MFS transporter permease subunit [Oscillochloris sp. ZM17-4]MBX0331099.1 DHA2 family efflux MFS transporter permease subunit [Oscillochloris sp. ZM17-4]